MNSLENVISEIRALKKKLSYGENDIFSTNDRRRIEIGKRRGMNMDPFITWKGADVIISQHALSKYRGGSTAVITVHAVALAKLFENLRNMNSGILDYLNKYQFYGEMAEAVNELLKSKKEPTENGVILAALQSAENTLTEWSKI